MTHEQSLPVPDVAAVARLRDALTERIGRVVVGQSAVVESLLLALICRGHVLLEGVPGTAKTLLARAFARCLQIDFGRIQFTPDLMPGDVIGSNLFSFQTGEFRLTRGPIFTDLLLADEINRTPPKTQAALLEAMQERTVTLDGKSHALSHDFLVVATQNPVEQEGTYPLPEAQLDRFLLKVVVGYPSEEDERDIVARHGHATAMPDLDRFDLGPVATREELREVRAIVSQLTLAPPLVEYIVTLVRRTREDRALVFGASPRAGVMMATAARALAALRGRPYVIPDDIQSLFLPMMRHRVVLGVSAEMDGSGVDSVLAGIRDSVPAPR